MSNPFEITVNGRSQQVLADDNDMLLYVLRNDADCKGVRFGCGAGQCGACMVWMDDRPVSSCDMPMWSAAGRRFTTIEDLGNDTVGAVVLDAFVQLQAAQCGYCINGILMSVTALLRQTASPTEAEIQHTLHRHLCRCGAHARILKAIDMAAERLRTGDGS